MFWFFLNQAQSYLLAVHRCLLHSILTEQDKPGGLSLLCTSSRPALHKQVQHARWSRRGGAGRARQVERLLLTEGAERPAAPGGSSRKYTTASFPGKQQNIYIRIMEFGDFLNLLAVFFILIQSPFGQLLYLFWLRLYSEMCVFYCNCTCSFEEKLSKNLAIKMRHRS